MSVCNRSCVSLCVCLCVFALAWPASCQCVALNPAKAKPNYRRTATDLAGMLTITEEAAGRGSLGKVTAGRELHKSGPQGQGRGGYSISGSGALIIYHSRSLGKKRQPTIDYTHGNKLAQTERHPKPPPRPKSLPPRSFMLPSTSCIQTVLHTVAFPSFICTNIASTVAITNLSPTM